MSDRPLEGKVAMVTGAASPIGLGQAMTGALVRAGARVALLDINDDWLAQTADAIRAIGGEDCAVPLRVDITDPTAAEGSVRDTIAALGGLHILINNAGISSMNPAFTRGASTNFWDLDPAAWSRVVAVNFSGAFFMSRAVAPHLMGQGWGRIISVTTSLDTMFQKGSGPYGPSKAGHEAFVAAMAKELEGSGVTANVLVPGGPANTNLNVGTPIGQEPDKLIQPDVMEAPVVWLASEASNEFNGQRIVARSWDEGLPVDERLQNASAPAAWPQLGIQSIAPGR